MNLEGIYVFMQLVSNLSLFTILLTFISERLGYTDTDKTRQCYRKSHRNRTAHTWIHCFGYTVTHILIGEHEEPLLLLPSKAYLTKDHNFTIAEPKKKAANIPPYELMCGDMHSIKICQRQ